MKKTKKTLSILLVTTLFSLLPVATVFAEDPPAVEFNIVAPPAVGVTVDEGPAPTPAPTPDPTPDPTPTPTPTPKSTAKTGPGVLLYAALPALGFVCRRKKNNNVEK